MSKMSFFYWHRDTEWSYTIRGRQMADYLCAEHNPQQPSAGSTCVLIKMLPYMLGRRRGTYVFDNPYWLDPIDRWEDVEYLRRKPHIPFIVSGLLAVHTLSGTHTNRIAHIPHHHCNYLRQQRPEGEITRIGYVGNMRAMRHDLTTASNVFRARGFEFVLPTSPIRTREDLIRFYSTIDIQLAWRPPVHPIVAVLKNPLKVVNAASFGIPTISCPDPSYSTELPGVYLEAESMDDAGAIASRLRDSPALYQEMSERAREASEAYHIEKIGQLYRALPNV